MFRKLTNLRYKRSLKEAVEFYLVYLFALWLFSGTATVIIGIIVRSNSPQDAALIGSIFAVGSTLTLSFLILKKKKLNDKILFLVLTLVSGIFAVLGGCLLGVLIPSYLTTLKAKN